MGQLCSDVFFQGCVCVCVLKRQKVVLVLREMNPETESPCSITMPKELMTKPSWLCLTNFQAFSTLWSKYFLIHQFSSISTSTFIQGGNSRAYSGLLPQGLKSNSLNSRVAPGQTAPYLGNGWSWVTFLRLLFDNVTLLEASHCLLSSHRLECTDLVPVDECILFFPPSLSVMMCIIFLHIICNLLFTVYNFWKSRVFIIDSLVLMFSH